MEKIILFGSRAWGKPDETSDLDLFIIAPQSNEPSYRRARPILRSLRGSGVPIDVVVQTHDEVERGKRVATSLIRTVLENGRVLYDREEALFATYACTGIRRSEILSLTLLDYDHGSGVIYLSRTKNGDRQTKIVPSALAGILIKRIRVVIRDHTPLQRSLLFPGRSADQAMSGRHVQARFDKWKKQAGIRMTLTIDSFRAGFATSLYETTGDIFLVARAMGHRDVSTTMRYINPNSSILRRAVEYTFQSPKRAMPLTSFSDAAVFQAAGPARPLRS